MTQVYSKGKLRDVEVSGDLDEDGNIIPEGLPMTIVRNADSTVSYITRTDGTSTWKKSFTYTAGLLNGISAWVKQ